LPLQKIKSQTFTLLNNASQFNRLKKTKIMKNLNNLNKMVYICTENLKSKIMNTKNKNPTETNAVAYNDTLHPVRAIYELLQQKKNH
jgi:hypothetical protein